MLAHFTYEEESTDSEGNRETSYYHYTVVYCELPQLAPFVQELVCHRRSGFRFMDSTEDKFRKRQRVELESEKFDKHYESFCGEHDDMNRVRQVYEPTFIVWLADTAPKHFEWDVVAGTLVCSIKGQADSTAELDGMCAAAGVVAKRLFDEAGESLPPASAAPSAPPTAGPRPPRRADAASAARKDDPAFATSAAASISITEGTRSSATTSWILGAARAARSDSARRASRRRPLAWSWSWSASGEPNRRERSRAAVSGASSEPGNRRASPSIAVGREPPHSRSTSATVSSRASGPPVTAAISPRTRAGARPEASPIPSRSSASGNAAIAAVRRRRAIRSISASGARNPAAGSARDGHHRREARRDERRGGNGRQRSEGRPGKLRRRPAKC